MLIAHLGRDGGDPAGFAAVAADFARRNPDYALHWYSATDAIGARANGDRVLFVQRVVGDAGNARVGDAASAVTCGDVLVQRTGQDLTADVALDVLGFDVPEPVPAEIPTFLRPDHDPRLTDTPGGCATDDDAYRRVVLTWLGQNGPFNVRQINAHRVRMTDSFSHYHPRDTGFDELYLVQSVTPGARVITSDHVDRIERPDDVREAELADLVTVTEVQVGDLLYAARGEMHRGVGGVLAHVITVPGFIPNAEIGVDHHLRRINERFGLSGDDALPINEAASHHAVIK